MIKVVADSIESSPENDGYIAFLREENGSQFFPLFLNRLDGSNLCYALQWSKEPPKIGNNFVKTLMGLTNLQVEKVVINDLQNNDYHAEIFITQNRRGQSI
jgi:bifunctional DNase/RNase